MVAIRKYTVMKSNDRTARMGWSVGQEVTIPAEEAVRDWLTDETVVEVEGQDEKPKKAAKEPARYSSPTPSPKLPGRTGN